MGPIGISLGILRLGDDGPFVLRIASNADAYNWALPIQGFVDKKDVMNFCSECIQQYYQFTVAPKLMEDAAASLESIWNEQLGPEILEHGNQWIP